MLNEIHEEELFMCPKLINIETNLPKELLFVSTELTK